jgi:hypothetical protein
MADHYHYNHLTVVNGMLSAFRRKCILKKNKKKSTQVVGAVEWDLTRVGIRRPCTYNPLVRVFFLSHATFRWLYIREHKSFSNNSPNRIVDELTIWPVYNMVFMWVWVGAFEDFSLERHVDREGY